MKKKGIKDKAVVERYVQTRQLLMEAESAGFTPDQAWWIIKHIYFGAGGLPTKKLKAKKK